MFAQNIIKQSSLNHIHQQLGATMIEESHWKRPNWYINPDKEMAQVVETVGICDISPVGKLVVEGKEIDKFLHSIGFESVLNRGSVVPYGVPAGRMVLCRMSQEQLVIVTSSENVQPITDAITSKLLGCLHLIDVTSIYTGILVCGPKSKLLLEVLTNTDLRESIFTNMTCVQARLADIHCMIIRNDRKSIPSYEIYVTRDLGEYLWNSIWDRGHDLELIPFGIEVLGRLRR